MNTALLNYDVVMILVIIYCVRACVCVVWLLFDSRKCYSASVLV